MQLQLYSRPGCSLCDDARRTLQIVQQEISFTYEEINIEQDPVLHERFCLMIPVVEKDGRTLQYGHIDYVTILEALEDN